MEYTALASPGTPPDLSSEVGERLAWVDATKGLAIVLVVFGHAWRGIHERGLVSEHLFHAVDSRVYAFHMPVFFAVSGLFLANSVSRMTPQAFTANRLVRLIWPLTLWTYLFIATKLIAGDVANNPVTTAELIRFPVPGYLHLWFLWALFLLQMAFLATRPLITNGRYSTTALTALAIFSIAIALAPLPSTIAYWLGSAIKHAPYLVLGIVIGQTGMLKQFGTIARITVAFIFLCVITEWPFIASDPVLRLAGSCMLTFGFIAVISGFGRSSSTWQNWIVSLGTSSMAIYLCHTVFSAAMREALLALHINSLGIHIIAGTIAGVVGGLAVLWLSNKTATKRILGF